MLRHLLVPLDGSPLAEAVLPAVGALATRFRARVTLLHVLETAAPETIHGQPHLTDPARAQAYLDASRTIRCSPAAPWTCMCMRPQNPMSPPRW